MEGAESGACEEHSDGRHEISASGRRESSDIAVESKSFPNASGSPMHTNALALLLHYPYHQLSIALARGTDAPVRSTKSVPGLRCMKRHSVLLCTCRFMRRASPVDTFTALTYGITVWPGNALTPASAANLHSSSCEDEKLNGLHAKTGRNLARAYHWRPFLPATRTHPCRLLKQQ